MAAVVEVTVVGVVEVTVVVGVVAAVVAAAVVAVVGANDWVELNISLLGGLRCR
jgi:hypothetical protein